MMKFKLIIELLSDACIGSGMGDGLSVDLDVCNNDGIPYIPAKRIKGLFKDAANEYSDNIEKIDCDSLFGASVSSGEDKNITGELYFTDGIIKNNNTSYITTRTNIKIDKETGITADGSLRFINVVNKGTIFESEIAIYDNKLDTKKLEAIAKLIKHIGVTRNRGFGLVKCHLELIKEEKDNINVINNSNGNEFDLKIRIHNVEPLLIASNNKDVSLPYIPSTTILGFFANSYAKGHDLSNKESNEYKLFSKLFLENKLVFSDAFISNQKYDEFIPTPSFILKLKNKDENGNTKYLNMLKDKGLNQAKKAKLNGSYINIYDLNDDNKNIDIKYPVFEYNYHLAKTSKDKEFFQYQSLSKDQYFIAKIKGDNDLINEFINLFKSDVAYFGKSKNSQYGLCKLEFEKIEKNKLDNEFNLIVFDKYTPIELFKLDNLNVDELIKSFKNKVKSYSIDIKPKGGYNLLWNLPKRDSYYITPGSYIEFENTINEIDNNLLDYIRVFNSNYLFEEKYELKLENNNKSYKGDEIKIKAFDYVENNKIRLNSTQISHILGFVRKYNNYSELLDALKEKEIEKKNNDLYQIITRIKKNTDLNLEETSIFKTYFNTIFDLYKYEAR